MANESYEELATTLLTTLGDNLSKVNDIYSQLNYYINKIRETNTEEAAQVKLKMIFILNDFMEKLGGEDGGTSADGQ